MNLREEDSRLPLILKIHAKIISESVFFLQKFSKEQLAGSMIDLRNTGHLMILTIILS